MVDSDIKSLERIVEKLDSTIEKLMEVSNNLGKLLAVHDTRLNIIEKEIMRNESDIRELHTKIEFLVKDLSNKIDQSITSSQDGHNKILEKMDEKIMFMDARIKVLEVWRWLVIGGALVIGYFVNKVFK